MLLFSSTARMYQKTAKLIEIQSNNPLVVNISCTLDNHMLFFTFLWLAEQLAFWVECNTF